MKLTIPKTLTRVIGTLAGLLGLFMLCTAPFTLPHPSSERNLVMILLALFTLLVAVYLLYVAYLVWFSFSPLAVQHVCGSLGLCLFALIDSLFEFDAKHDPHAVRPALVLLGCLLFVLLAYRFGRRYLSRLLFPESSPGVQP